MKPIEHALFVTRSCATILLAFTCSQFIACGSGGDDPGPGPSSEQTAAQKVTAKLSSATWKVGTVTVDGTDQSAMFKNFTITFTSTGFTTANGGAVWPASSNWTFTDANATGFTRGDGVTVQLQEITDTALKMSLAWSKTTLGPGRIESIKGQHVFTMGK